MGLKAENKGGEIYLSEHYMKYAIAKKVRKEFLEVRK
jgi:hypothetical protein